LIVKTKKRLFEALTAEVKGIHSYTVPEIIALPIVQGQEDYLKWLSESTRTEEEAVKNSRKGFK